MYLVPDTNILNGHRHVNSYLSTILSRLLCLDIMMCKTSQFTYGKYLAFAALLTRQFETKGHNEATGKMWTADQTCGPTIGKIGKH